MERQERSAEEKPQPLEPTGTHEFKNAGGDYNNKKLKKVQPEKIEKAQDVRGDGSTR